MFSISIPLPGLDDKTVKELNKLFVGMQAAADAGPVRGGVISEGDASAYALVWEFGNARQTQPGPRTVLGTGPNGESAWLSIQAPMGYIRVNEPEYIQILETALIDMDMDLSSGNQIRKEMLKASAIAAEKIADMIRDHAPKDTGALRDSIGPADPEDPDLALEENGIELGRSEFQHKGMRKALKKQNRDNKRKR